MIMAASTGVGTVMDSVGRFFLYMVVALFAQNAVFSRAFGVSRLVKMVEDDTDTVIFGVLLCCVQLIAAPLGYAANLLLAGNSARMYVRPLVLAVCTVAAYFVVMLFVAVVFRKRGAKQMLALLPMASFNCVVGGTLLVSTTQSFTLSQTMGFAAGSGVGYVLATMLVNEAQHRLQNRSVPTAFRGLPITLLYIGILALAVYGFAGHAVAY